MTEAELQMVREYAATYAAGNAGIWYGKLLAELDAVKTELAAALAERDEFEDSIRLLLAEEREAMSCGRNEQANRVLADIRARRGEDWQGVTIDFERKAPR